jgi:type I restriction enzyme S subunit
MKKILNWTQTNLADKKYFNVLGSGVNYFKGLKYYYSTSSVDGSKVIGPEGEFTFFDRPSRANMQPLENSVWFAKMKNTLKVINSDTFHNESVIFSTGFCGIACNNVSPDFLEQFFLSEEFNTQKDNLSEGSTQQAINNSKLKEIKIYIPDDINEQKKIAEVLTKVNEAIENTEALIQKYERIKLGLMQDLLTKGIDEKGNIRSEETHQFKDSPLGRIPVEWDYSALGDIYNMKSGITPSRSNKNYFDENGTNWVKTLDLNESFLYTTEEKVSNEALKYTAISILPINSILIAMYGGWEQIGRTSIIKVPSSTNQAITSLYNPKINLLSEFTMYSLQTNRWRWKQFAVSTRKDPNITKKDISNFIIAFPSNENEQTLIVDRIIEMINLNNVLKNKLQKLQNQKHGLMQDLLSGKVRVNY